MDLCVQFFLKAGYGFSLSIIIYIVHPSVHCSTGNDFKFLYNLLFKTISSEKNTFLVRGLFYNSFLHKIVSCDPNMHN